MFINLSNQVRQAYRAKVNKGAIGMANNTVRVANPTTPVRSGRFKRSAHTKSLGEGAAAAYWPGAMAQFLNRGSRRDGTHRIKRWTTAGTGSGFVDKGLNDTQAKYRSFFE